MSALTFPGFVTFGAGTPTITGGPTNDIDGIVATGASGIRMGIVWDAANSNHDGTTLSPSYMARIEKVVEYCNNATLEPNVLGVAGIPGLAVDLQVAIGPTFAGQLFNEHAAGGINVPRNIAIFYATIAAHFAPGNGLASDGSDLVLYALELTNEPNHVKASNPLLDGGVLASRAAWLAAGSPAVGYKALSYVKMWAVAGTLAHAANPGLIRMQGGLGGHADDAADVPIWTFTQDMYDSRFTSGGYTVGGTTYNAPTGIHGLIDQSNQHPYCYMATPTQDLALAATATKAADVTSLTTVAAGSNGVNTSTFQGAGTLHLASSATLTYGAVQVATATKPALITYTGVSGNDLTGCETVSGGGVLATGGAVKTFARPNPNGARGWFQFVCLTRPIIAAGGGHSDALDPTLPIEITEFGQPDPFYGNPPGPQQNSIGDACAALSSACAELTSYSWWTSSCVFSWFCWQDDDETGLPNTSPPRKWRWYGLVGCGNGQWVGDTTPFGHKADSSGDLWQTFHDLFTATGGATAPKVTGLSATHGPVGGGNTITISGVRFNPGGTPASAVKFGTVNATSFTVVNATTITAVVPAGTGQVNVFVTTTAGTSTAAAGNLYTYDSAPGLGLGLNILAPTTATGCANVMALAKGLFTAAGSTDEIVLRVQPEWGHAQSNFAGTTAGQNDAFVWDRHDLLLAAADTAGVRLQFVIGYTPNGLQQVLVPPRGDKCYPNRDANKGYRDVANYVWSLCDRAETNHPGVLKAVEIWNEPSGTFLYPINVGNYTAMLVACYAAVKTGVIEGRTDNPARVGYSTILVGTGGVSPESPGTNGAVDKWHAGIVANGGKDSFDWAGHHPYGLPCPPTKANTWNQRLHGLPELRTVLDGAGRTDAEIWLTEDGTFNRPDSTATDTTGQHSIDNCSTLGSGADPLNNEVTEALTATRIMELCGHATTTVAAASNGVNTSTFTGTQTLTVADTTGSADVGTVNVATAGTVAVITYSGITGTTYKNCKTASGGGVMATGGAVTYLGWWQANRTKYKLGVLNYYELEDSNDNTHAGDWANHGGIYQVSSTHNGTVKTEIHDAFVSALGGTGAVRSAPTCSIISPADDSTHATPWFGYQLILITATDGGNVDSTDKLVVKLYRANGSTFVKDATYGPIVPGGASGWYVLFDTTTLTDADYVFVVKATNTAVQTTTSNQPNGIRARITNVGTNNNPPVGSFVSVSGLDMNGNPITVALPAAAPVKLNDAGQVTIEVLVTDDHDSTVSPIVVLAGTLPLGTAAPKPGSPNHYLVTFDPKNAPHGVLDLTGTATDSDSATGTFP